MFSAICYNVGHHPVLGSICVYIKYVEPCRYVLADSFIMPRTESPHGCVFSVFGMKDGCIWPSRFENSSVEANSSASCGKPCGPDWTMMRQGWEATAEMKKTGGSRNGVVALGSDVQHTLRNIMHHPDPSRKMFPGIRLNCKRALALPPPKNLIEAKDQHGLS